MSKKVKVIIILVVIAIVATTAGIFISREVKEAKRNPLVGTWHAEDKTVSMQFFENGTAKVTYNNVKLPVINLNYNGTVNATYAYDSETGAMSVTINVYSKEITMNYTYKIDENLLTLTDTSTKKAQKFIAEYVPEE